MDVVFSVEDMSDPSWSSSSSSAAAEDIDKKPRPTMNRSDSEWAFQKFITEEVDKKGEEKEGETTGDLEKNGFSESNKNNNVPVVDVDEYHAFLKNKLNLACAAVAMSRASFVKPQYSVARADSGPQTSNTLQPGSKATPKGAGDKAGNALVGFPSFLNGKKKFGSQVRPSMIGSSSEMSEEDELEGENDTMENTDPADAKRVWRMLSNRESARRSRRRKQTHLSELKTQVAQLRIKKAALLKHLTDISQKYNNAAVCNRVLKADVETLETKVKLAEESVKRIFGLSHVPTETSRKRMPSFDGSPSDKSTDAAVPVNDGSKHPIYQVAANKPIIYT